MRLVIPKSRHSKKLEYGMYETWMERPIYINYVPYKDLHLVHKKYVDDIVNNLDLTKIQVIVNRDVFPHVKGEFHKKDNQYYINKRPKAKSDKPVSMLDHRGLVIDNKDKINPNDWPNMSSDFILKSSRPKTLEEWGIKDIVKLDGTGHTNKSFIYKGPKHSKSPVTRNDADGHFKDKVKYDVGDIIMANPADMEGRNDFHPLSGDLLNKKNYPELYKVIGDDYGGQISRHNGQPWRVFRHVNEPIEPPTNIVAVNLGHVNGLIGFSVAVTNERVYFIGGSHGSFSSPYSDIYVSTISNGSISKPVKYGNLPEPRIFSRAVAFNNRLYIIGGAKNAMSNEKNVPILTCQINPNGTLGAWSKLPGIPETIHDPLVYTNNSRLFIIGGSRNNNPTSSNEYSSKSDGFYHWCNISLDGKLGPWHKVINPYMATLHGDEVSLWGTWNVHYMESPLVEYGYFRRIETMIGTHNRISPRYGHDTRKSRIYSYSALLNSGNMRYVGVGEGGVTFMTTRSKPYGGPAAVGVNENELFMKRTWRENNAVRSGFYSEFIKLPPSVNQPRDYHRTIATSRYIYVLGGATGNVNENKNKSSRLNCIRMNIKDGPGLDDYSERYSPVKVIGAEFKLPEADPVIYYSNSYDYYIKVK